MVSFKRERNGMKCFYSSTLLPVGNETQKRGEMGFVCFLMRAFSAVTLNLYPLPTSGNMTILNVQGTEMF